MGLATGFDTFGYRYAGGETDRENIILTFKKEIFSMETMKNCNVEGWVIKNEIPLYGYSTLNIEYLAYNLTQFITSTVALFHPFTNIYNDWLHTERILEYDEDLIEDKNKHIISVDIRNLNRSVFIAFYFDAGVYSKVANDVNFYRIWLS